MFISRWVFVQAYLRIRLGRIEMVKAHLRRQWSMRK